MTTYGASSDLTTLLAGAIFSDDAAWRLKGDRSLREALGFCFFHCWGSSGTDMLFFGPDRKKATHLTCCFWD